jgi:hypothetical protein
LASAEYAAAFFKFYGLDGLTTVAGKTLLVPVP